MYAGIENGASAEETLPAKNTGCNRDHKRHILSYKCNYAGGMGKKKKKPSYFSLPVLIVSVTFSHSYFVPG